MNTQATLQRIEAGQALAYPRRGAREIVLVQGEVLVQAPAQWLGGTVVVPRAVRLVAPAVLPGDSEASVVAVRASTLVVQESAPLFASSAILGAIRWLRRIAPRRLLSHARHAA